MQRAILRIQKGTHLVSASTSLQCKCWQRRKHNSTQQAGHVQQMGVISISISEEKLPWRLPAICKVSDLNAAPGVRRKWTSNERKKVVNYFWGNWKNKNKKKTRVSLGKQAKEELCEAKWLPEEQSAEVPAMKVEGWAGEAETVWGNKSGSCL